MEVAVKEARSFREYIEPWKRAMQTTAWFRERRLFDYNSEEIMEDIKHAFQESRGIFLVAERLENHDVVGVLGATVANNVAMLGRWEPAVSSIPKRTEIGERLLKEAFRKLREQQVSRIRCILKFPYSKPQRARWHKELYRKCGFVLERPSGVLLLADLSKYSKKPPDVPGLCISDGSKFSLENYADFTKKAFLSTPSDKLIHQSDPYISNRPSLLRSLAALKAGRFGFSPQECWKVAELNDSPAGFIIGFIREESKYSPAHGIIGQLGVFPEFRRRGIGTVLVAELLSVFRERQCAYSLVGTPKTNHPGLRFYATMGYSPVFEQTDLQKIL